MRLPSSRFVKEYLVDLNATQAAIRAGYSAKTAYSIGHENLKKPEIAEAIAEARKAIEEKLDITVDMIVRELAKLGFSNMLDYTRITDDGLLAADLSNLTPDRAAAITEVTCESVPIPGGTEGGVVTKTKIKLADKRAALVELGKHLGMFKRAGDSAEHPREPSPGERGGQRAHHRSLRVHVRTFHRRRCPLRKPAWAPDCRR